MNALQPARIFLLIFLFSIFTALHAQCPKRVVYYKGSFYPIHYSKHYDTVSLSKQGYPSCNGLIPANMDSLAKADQYTYYGSGDSISICSGIFTLFYNGTKWGIWDDFGKQISPFLYDYAFYYHPKNKQPTEYEGEWEKNECALVRTGRNWGLLNGFGKSLAEVRYQLPKVIQPFNEKDSILFTKEGLSHPSDSANRCPGCWGGMMNYPLFGTHFIFTESSKAGAIDSTGKVRIPFIYDTLCDFNKGCMMGSRGGKRYYLTQAGKEISGYDEVHPVMFLDIKPYPFKQFFSGIYLIKKGGKWGMINSMTNQVIKPRFDADILEEDFQSQGEHQYVTLKVNKKMYSLEISKNSISIKDVDDNEVSTTFIDK